MDLVIQSVPGCTFYFYTNQRVFFYGICRPSTMIGNSDRFLTVSLKLDIFFEKDGFSYSVSPWMQSTFRMLLNSKKPPASMYGDDFYCVSYVF
jgi:hypothetical protein